MEIQAHITNGGAPLVAPTDAPEVQIRRSDTDAIVQAFAAMDENGDGQFVFDFTIPDTATNYTFLVDADPNTTGQVTAAERYQGGGFSGLGDLFTAGRITGLDNLDATVSSRNAVTPLAAATDQAEHDATQAAIAGLNDLSQADVQAALDAQGYTAVRAALLDNLDAAVSSRNAVTPMAAATSQAEHDATQAAIAALNDIGIADVQTALTNQGYTVGRAPNLDNLDATVSSRNSVTPLAAAVDQAEHDATQAGIAANLAAIAALNDISVGDILSAVLTSGNTVDAELSGILAMRDFIEGGRDIDFVGNDALGWQRIERDTAGALVRRYNLFDEGGARITGTVTAFINAGKMIAAEVAI